MVRCVQLLVRVSVSRYALKPTSSPDHRRRRLPRSRRMPWRSCIARRCSSSMLPRWDRRRRLPLPDNSACTLQQVSFLNMSSSVFASRTKSGNRKVTHKGGTSEGSLFRKMHVAQFRRRCHHPGEWVPPDRVELHRRSGEWVAIGPDGHKRGQKGREKSATHSG